MEGLTPGELPLRPVKGSRVPGRLRAGLAGGVACGLFEAPGLTAPRGRLRPGMDSGHFTESGGASAKKTTRFLAATSSYTCIA